MEKIIAKYDYAHASDETLNEMTDDLKNSDDRFAPGLDVNGMKNIISTFVKKVCVQPFPKQQSPGYYMCKRTLYYIIAVMEACVSEHHTLTEAQCQELLFDLILDFVSKGQGSTHYEIMNADIYKQFHFLDYIKELRGVELNRLLDAIKQQKYIEEEDCDVDEYSEVYERAMSRLIEYALGNGEGDKHMEPDIHDMFLDLYIIFVVQITKNSERMANRLSHCKNKIYHRYNRKPYIGCSNIELYRRHFKVIKQLLLDEDFPRHKVEIDATKDAVFYMLRGIVDNLEILKALWTELHEFFTNVTASSNSTELLPVIESYNTLCDKIPETFLQENPDLFGSWAQKMAEMLHKGTNKEFVDTMASRQIREMIEKIKPVANFIKIGPEKKSGHDKCWIPIVQGLLRHPTKDLSYRAYDILRCNKMKKFWNWKKNVEEAKQIVITAKEADVPMKRLDRARDNDEIIDRYGKAINELFKQLKLVKVNHSVMPELALLIISTLEKKSTLTNELAKECVENLDFTKNQDLIPEFLQRFSVQYFDPDYLWDEGWTTRVGTHVLQFVIKAYSDSKDIPGEVNDLMISICNHAMADDTERLNFERRSISFFGQVASSITLQFMILHLNGSTEDVCSPLIPRLFKMMEEDDETIQKTAKTTFQLISTKAPKLIAVDEDFDQLIQRYLDKRELEVIGSIHNLYPHNTDVMARRFQEFMATLGKDKDNTSMIFMLLHIISEKQPEIFTKENVNAMSEHLDNDQAQMFVLMAWSKIVAKNLDHLLDQMEVILTKKNLPLTGTHFIQEILSTVAAKYKRYMQPVMKYLIDLSKNENQIQVLSVFFGLRKLADRYGSEPFKPYRPYLDELKKTSSSYVKDAVSHLIDVLENRSLETIATDVKEVKEDVEELDERVTGTEVVIGGVVKQVERHEGEITDVKEGVVNVNKRVDDVEEDMEEVKEKVEEIDMKTMSNAPTWSRDLTKLLNPKSDHDWRLLASRLGYSNDDIRAWSTQSDPCMALLSEWYATHKTIEATNGVLNILQEMNRLDAAIIVENAMKAAEDIVEDEEFEYASPPPVFLSYQWGHQNEVKLLKQHLEMAGYVCWMDIGQMGGGDKLFEKIDAGIRGAKVVICCVSEKYAKSPNCNREVNLAVNLRKPMIPLQIEKIAWPPVGSMGPIFSEYLYIRFYSGGKGGKYWADAKFQEMLMQLQFNGLVPDDKLITPEYKNWWIPVAEEIIITQKDDKSGGKSNKKDEIPMAGEDKDRSPEVFLSYQWGKQKQIQALYKRLTGLGLTCWMDIHQMGGGDSLYDKIDRGVRGCKVVVSSVTQKYALSANCRREVSLADALKKPVIPLLLEEITWPPSGPMSMVFTQLLYINFCKNPDIQMNWKGKEFDELMNKLRSYIPASEENKTEQKKTKPRADVKNNNQNKVEEEKQDKSTPVVSNVEKKESNNQHIKVTNDVPSSTNRTETTNTKTPDKSSESKPKEMAPTTSLVSVSLSDNTNRDNNQVSTRTDATNTKTPDKSSDSKSKETAPETSSTSVSDNNTNKNTGNNQVSTGNQNLSSAAIKAPPPKKSSTCDIL